MRHPGGMERKSGKNTAGQSAIYMYMHIHVEGREMFTTEGVVVQYVYMSCVGST